MGFLSVDTAKRNKAEKGVSIVSHSSVPFGIKNLDTESSQITEIMLDNISKYLPSLPKTDHKWLQKWRYSQVSVPFKGQPGYIILNEKPLILCAGDSFVGSNLDNCIDSAEATVQVISNFLNE